MEMANKPKRVKKSDLNKTEVKTPEVEKVTTKRVRSFRLRTSETVDTFRKSFYLWGTVQKVSKSGEAILVSNGALETQTFWMDIDPSKQAIKEGDKCKFQITISSFVGRDKVYRTKLRVVEALLLPCDAYDDLQNGFSEGYGIMDVNIVASSRTDTPGLFMLSMHRMDENGEPKEWYYMRYFADNRQHPDLGVAKVGFLLGKSKDLITDKGEIYTDVETRTYVDENGETVTKQSPVYVPALQVKFIER